MRGWAVHLAWVLAAGCGRIGFAPLDDTAGDGDGGNRDGNGNGDGDGSSTVMLVFPATADTALNSFATTLNYGAATAFNIRADAVTTFVGLVRFDLPGATGIVTAATLRISTSLSVLTAGRIDVARVLEAWSEGTQTAGAGVANQDQRQTGTAWTTAGCGPGSREGTPIAAFQPFTADTRYEVMLPVAVVQGWVDDPASNHGIALFAVGTGNDTVTFFSRESDLAPELVVHLDR